MVLTARIPLYAKLALGYGRVESPVSQGSAYVLAAPPGLPGVAGTPVGFGVGSVGWAIRHLLLQST